MNRNKTDRSIRWASSVTLVVLGLTLFWAWGQVARLAGPGDAATEAGDEALYAAWRPQEQDSPSLFRSSDAGTTWQAVQTALASEPVAWADDGQGRIAVALNDGTVQLSRDQGEHWAAFRFPVPSGTRSTIASTCTPMSGT